MGRQVALAGTYYGYLNLFVREMLVVTHNLSFRYAYLWLIYGYGLFMRNARSRCQCHFALTDTVSIVTNKSN